PAPAAGGAPQQITSDRSVIRGLDFTPDGNSVIFSSNRGGTQRLWQVALTNGQPQLFSAPGLNAMHPAVSPVGRKLAYTEWQSNTNIWRFDISVPIAETNPLIS